MIITQKPHKKVIWKSNVSFVFCLICCIQNDDSLCLIQIGSRLRCFFRANEQTPNLVDLTSHST